MGCAQCGGMKKKNGGAMKKMAAGGRVAKRNISKPGAGFAPATMGSNEPANVFGIPNAGQTGPNRRVTTETMKAGGNFAPNRAVQSSCKNGMVRDANGKCVMSRMSKGGFPDLNKDGKVTKADVLKGRGVIKKKGGAVRTKRK